MSQLGIANVAAFHVLRALRQPGGDYSADQLNALVAAWPDPVEAMRIAGMDISAAPVLFQDITVGDVALKLQEFIEGASQRWPVFWLPESYMRTWVEDGQAKIVLKLFHEWGLDIQLTVGGSPVWFKGDWMMPCDMRIRFRESVTRLQLEKVEQARLTYQRTGVLQLGQDDKSR